MSNTIYCECITLVFEIWKNMLMRVASYILSSVFYLNELVTDLVPSAKLNKSSHFCIYESISGKQNPRSLHQGKTRSSRPGREEV